VVLRAPRKTPPTDPAPRAFEKPPAGDYARAMNELGKMLFLAGLALMVVGACSGPGLAGAGWAGCPGMSPTARETSPSISRW